MICVMYIIRVVNYFRVWIHHHYTRGIWANAGNRTFTICAGKHTNNFSVFLRVSPLRWSDEKIWNPHNFLVFTDSGKWWDFNVWLEAGNNNQICLNRFIGCRFCICSIIGKPAFLTIADCEFKARRIQNAVQSHTALFSPFATKSNAFRTHSDVESSDRRMASAIADRVVVAASLLAAFVMADEVRLAPNAFGATIRW